MSIINHLQGWTVPQVHEEVSIHTYSTVGDILSYQRCQRQYGYFSVRGYSSASSTQRYFGTLMHDVLDQVNREYRATNQLPDLPVLTQMVEQAHHRLIRSGVRAYNPRAQQDRAIRLIHRFIQLFGTAFFNEIRQTEYRLSRALRTHTHRDYILEGIVDVLSGAVSHALQLPYSTEPDDIEIWDYKSGSMPAQGSRELQSYKYQMRVYAELYRQQTGIYPARSVLVFLGELDDDVRWANANGNLSLFPNLVYAVDANPAHIATAITNFNNTVDTIEQQRRLPYNVQWQAPVYDPEREQTCRACDLGYNCDGYPQGRARRQQVL
jgi:hypothetical protein